MRLPETFDAVRPGIVAFISRVARAAQDQGVPLFPRIIGTGFFVDDRGIAVTNRHVIEALEIENQLPPHPATGVAPIGALVFTEIKQSGSETSLGVLNVDIIGWNALATFSADSPWYGEGVPDLGFVQLNVREAPKLSLTTGPNILRTGIPIATAGFPEGEGTITFHERITQMTPVLRHGIISSVFPFGGARPHGFSIDTLLQGGASGSPVFMTDEPVVVGMIASQIRDTNFTVAIPSDLLAGALSEALHTWPAHQDIPRLLDLIEAGEASGEETLNWVQYPPPAEPA